MPKMKSHSGAKKRFSYTGSGKLSYRKAGRNHILEHKSSKRSRRLRKKGYVSPTLAGQIEKMLPYA